MMGGGFGGCTINIVPAGEVETFIEKSSIAYRERFGHDMEAYVVSVEDGTGFVEI